MTDVTTAATPRAKLLAAVLAFASVAALAWASLSSRWMISNQTEGVSYFGLRDMEACVGDTCIGESNAAFVDDASRAGAEHASSAFATAGWVCTIALWIAAAALALAAALMLTGRFIGRPIAPTTVSMLGLAIGLVSGVVFVAMKPDPSLGPGPACAGFALGELGGIVASILVARIRPADPDWDDPKPFDEDKW